MALQEETHIHWYFKHQNQKINKKKKHLPALYVPHSWSDKIPYE